MNSQNQKTPCDPPKRFRGLHAISDEQYLGWTSKWKQEVEKPKKLLPYFKNDNDFLVRKIYFNDETVINLVSAVGIENIHARFAIVDRYEPYEITTDTFVIILFATDNQGNKCSAYHVGLPEYHYDLWLPEVSVSRFNDAGYVCDLLAMRWIHRWQDIVKPIEEIQKYEKAHPGFAAELEFPCDLFRLEPYGDLLGYKYVMRDFMYSLYPPGTRIKNYDVIILLAAHDRVDYVSGAQKNILTFGLVVAGTEIKNTVPVNQGGQDQQVNSYYDLSLPCPPNQ